jgi:hypothetical protein
MTKNPRTRGFSTNVRMNQMIDDLMFKKGYTSVSGLIQTAIGLMYSKEFPAYAVNSLTTGRGGLSPEEQGEIKARIKQSKEKAEEDAKIAVKKNICENMLFGRVDVGEEDEPICRFTNYTTNTDYDQILPLRMLSTNLANNLFIPSKQAVLNARPELKDKLGIKDEDII